MTKKYTPTAIALHWLIAFGLGAMVVLGLYMTSLSFSPTKLQLYSWHKWAGVSLFLLVAVRLVWRLFNRPPELPESMSAAARLAASVAHLALYALMIAIPLTGWLMSSAKGFQTVWFGVLPIPDLLPKNPALGDQLRDVHEILNYILIAAVGGHALAAFKHHFFDRDDVLTRMLPGINTK
jgi:cytochrome b561